VIGWGSILYGATLSAVFTVGALAGLRERRTIVIATAGFSALVAPIGWNAILRATHADEFFTDLPVAAFPASWQDFGSGVFTVALASLSLGVVLRSRAAGESARVAIVAGLAAFLVDIYLY
jgi:hypothetical protein